MSWFNRKPRLREPSRPSAPHRTSPASEKILKEAKKLGPKKKLKKQWSISLTKFYPYKYIDKGNLYDNKNDM